MSQPQPGHEIPRKFHGSSHDQVQKTKSMANVHDSVKEYYGKVLQKTEDLQSNACCTSGAPPKYIKEVLSSIHDEVQGKYYGCGLVVPDELQGMTILDLGSGSGRDCYLLSHLVGEKGKVIGVDMTKQQVDVANKYIEYHTQKFGYAKSNVEFKLGFIEDLKSLGIQDNSVDIIVSNCVINLSPDKEAVLREAFRVLKVGGELYFSDVYSDRRIAKELVQNEVLYGECLSGALYWNDFLNLAKRVGFKDPRLVEDSKITIDNKKIEELVGHIGFYSATYRLFKLPHLEPACEDYGQGVMYKGTLTTAPRAFKLDSHHLIPSGKVFPVCGNTLAMLKETRFSRHFEYFGNQNVHYGIYPDCGTSLPFQSANNEKDQSCSDGKKGGCC
jgi:arsenite methyltransferase